MTSVTSEFGDVLHDESDNSIHSRNAISTAKRRHRRKILTIKPLRLEELQKELEESENDTQPDHKLVNKENDIKNDSFEMSFAALSLTTPAKLKTEIIKDGDFATPQTKPLLLSTQQSQQTNRALDFRYITPSNKVVPKVQCSINMQTYLKTPIDRVCMPATNKPACDVKMQIEAPIPSSFRKIKVNNVEYIVLNELGKGGSSEVFHCFNEKAKVHRAVKCVSLQNPSSAPGFINEVKMLKALQKCNRIIKMYDFEIKQESKTLLVVLEVGGADLSKILKESALNTAHVPMYMLIYYWMEMLYAVQQIHSNGIIHSDLKPANFLKVEGYLKLIDFGIASCIQSDMTSVIKAVPEGSLNYISPEALNNESSSNKNSPSYGTAKYKVSFKSDVWSLGCILYQLVYRRTPFQHITQMWAKMVMLSDPNHKIDYPDADWVPQKIINTMKKCLQYNMKLRPSVDDLISEYENIFQSVL